MGNINPFLHILLPLSFSPPPPLLFIINILGFNLLGHQYNYSHPLISSRMSLLMAVHVFGRCHESDKPWPLPYTIQIIIAAADDQKWKHDIIFSWECDAIILGVALLLLALYQQQGHLQIPVHHRCI